MDVPERTSLWHPTHGAICDTGVQEEMLLCLAVAVSISLPGANLKM